MATITLNSNLVALNMQNYVWKAQFMIPAVTFVEIMVVSFSTDEKITFSLGTSFKTLNVPIGVCVFSCYMHKILYLQTTVCIYK